MHGSSLGSSTWGWPAMNDRRRCHPVRQERGVALLIVLGTLVAVSASALLIARNATLSHTEDTLRTRERLCSDALRAAESPIREWLQSISQRVVLPPDADEPRVEVFADRWGSRSPDSGEYGEGISCAIRITAWDQCGMAPVEDRVDSLGLDLLEPAGERSVFPSALSAQALRTRPPALGATTATHNPGRPGGQPRLNVNTAPLGLVSSAFREAGIGGIEQVTEARANGKPAPLAELRVTRRGGAGSARIVGNSNAWAFRIDATADRVTRSWWEVWIDTGSGWQRVQRLEIP